MYLLLYIISYLKSSNMRVYLQPNKPPACLHRSRIVRAPLDAPLKPAKKQPVMLFLGKSENPNAATSHPAAKQSSDKHL